MTYNLHPGPLESDLLHSNSEHRATFLFNCSIDQTSTFRIRRSDAKFWSLVDNIPNPVIEYIKAAGFGGIIEVGNRRIDNALLNALIERWRPETHTFHFPRIGEATVTLQDDQVLWGLRVSGDVVTGLDLKSSTTQWNQEVEEYLGFTPKEGDIKKGSIKLSCLINEIERPLPHNASRSDYQKRARVYILHLIGGTLFPNNSGNLVFLYHLSNLQNINRCGLLSWGSAVLACLYRRLCKATKPDAIDICGPLGLLQLWAWERIQTVAPTLVSGNYNFTKPYGARWNSRESGRSFNTVTSHVLTACRSQLTTLTTNEFIWTPYNGILHRLPEYCTENQESWRCRTYLIYWDVAETHEPNRVMRQFGMFQAIPEPPLFTQEDYVREHSLSRIGRYNMNWATEHQIYIDNWEKRLENIKTSPYVNNFSPDGQYISWFHRKTVQYITNPGQQTVGFQPLGEQRELLMDGMTAWHNQSVNPDLDNSGTYMSQQYMDYIHMDDRFALRPSNFVQNYTPVPQQHLQREPPRRRQQQHSNINPDMSGAPNVGDYQRSNVNMDAPSSYNVFGGSSSHFGGTSTQFQGPESMPFFGQDSMSQHNYYTPQNYANQVDPFTSPYMMPHQMGQSSRPQLNFSPFSIEELDFDFQFSENQSTQPGSDESRQHNRRPRRNRQPPDCGTGGRYGDHP